MKIVELKQNIFKENEVTADKIRDEFKKQGKLMINVMSSPGSGKTTTLLRTIERLKDICRVGVMECDIDASVDAQGHSTSYGWNVSYGCSNDTTRFK